MPNNSELSKVYLYIGLWFLIWGIAKMLLIEAICLFYNFIFVELYSKLIDIKLLA